jgi:hypothetical protein
VCLLAEMNAMEERMEDKIGAEMKTNWYETKTNEEWMEAKIDDGQEEMKSQVAFLAPLDQCQSRRDEAYIGGLSRKYSSQDRDQPVFKEGWN